MKLLATIRSFGLVGRLASIALVAVAPMVAVIGVMEQRRQAAIERDFLDGAADISTYAARTAAGVISGAHDAMRTIAALPGVRNGDTAACNTVLSEMRESFSRYTALALSDAKGNTLCSAPPMDYAVNFGDRPWFGRVMAQEGAAIGEYIVGPISGRHTLRLSYVFPNAAGTERLALFAGLDPAWLSRLLISIPHPDWSVIVAFDVTGALVASSRPVDKLGEAQIGALRRLGFKPDLQPAIHRLSTGDEWAGEEWAVAVARIGEADANAITFVTGVNISRATPTADASRWTIMAALAGVVILVVLAMTAAGWALVVRPLRRLGRAVQTVAAGDLATQVGEPYPGGELGAFMRSFDAMAAQLRLQMRRIMEDRRAQVDLYRRLDDCVYRMAPSDEPTVTFISDRVATLLDVAPAALLGPRHSWNGVEILDPRNEDLHAAMRRAIAARAPIDLTYRVKTPSGQIRWIWERADPVNDLDGLWQGYEGVLTDITDRKAKEDLAIRDHAALVRLYGQMLRSIASLSEARDPYTAGHQRRVASLSVAIARELGLEPHRIAGLMLAAEIHDVGKIGVPGDILAKPGKLSAGEFAIIREHPAIAFAALKDIAFPWPIPQIIVQHHERLDGSGYPAGLKGDQILLEARILAVADVVESMMSHRPYRPGRAVQEVRAELEAGSERLYDARVVGIALRFIDSGEIHLDEDGQLVPLPVSARSAA